MPDWQPLDLRIEIADLFDEGTLVAPVSLDEIAARVTAHRNSVKRAISVLGFTTIEKRTKKMDDIPARFAPPRRFAEGKFPTLNRRSSPTTHAVLRLVGVDAPEGRCCK